MWGFVYTTSSALLLDKELADSDSNMTTVTRTATVTNTDLSDLL
ncbi:hypothetical protein HanXRQr2_Chr15g0684101 [Helianthus annuus]|uniref:Uncharacterized protein n=1 Tax=Helianthus annuus TaxID=4232 RepID=A0A9K3E017_HELAN|nr:hypothetical protein HanXRQr2_Chr15g0684101 [Helianthus annuus]